MMNKSVKYEPTMDEAVLLVNEGETLLNKFFDCLHETDGLWAMFTQDGKFWAAKGWLIEAMKRHPNYNGRYQIILKDQDFHRYLDINKARDFIKYVQDFVTEHMVMKSSEDGAEIPIEEYFKIRNLWNEKIDGYRDKYYETRYSVYLKGYTKYLDIKSNDPWDYKPSYMFVRSVLPMMKKYLEENGYIADDQFCQKFNRESERYKVKVKCHTGQKMTKLMQKVCKLIDGLLTDVQIKDDSFVRQDGTIVKRTKDIGWNYQYAAFCDACNPVTFKGTAVISVNPIDFWTMSFGDHWASCHTIDKNNIRRNDHNYSGCYCGGTESYMLDNSSILFYFLPNDFNGEYPEKEDKIKRCVFYLGEDKLIQSRVYPDGRDGGDKSLAGDIRAIMQKVVSEIFDLPNYWTVVRGTRECTSMISSYGPHYRDYEDYEDCNVSYLKRAEGKNTTKIKVGSDIICPCCGKEYYHEDNIFCDECVNRGYVSCDRCYERVRIEDAYVIDDNLYCPDCVQECDECHRIVPCNDTRLIYNNECICDDCFYSGRYTYSTYEGCMIRDEDVVRTVESRICHRDGTGYFVCPTCNTIHNSEYVFTWNGNRYCEDCYDAMPAEEEAE